ncbi:MAG TPA: LLM class F420-dependent oxidoreductase [Candidatus Binataceae bacterium]|nr:LLM class F420-dependent oxidoreductase [Candidatus Binataceae bacterium]
MANISHPIRFGIQTPQQHTTWPEMLSLWQEVDTLGYDTAWVFDHFLPIFSDPTGPCLEGWTALAALAMATRNVRLGAMVTGNTYRHPAVLAKMATTVDIISGGRLILGIGAGWFELEHQEYGVPFPTTGGRLRRLDEALDLIRLLWTQERASFNGRYYSLKDASFNPKPLQKPHPPILVGASGENIALGIVARHAQMWNSFGTPDVFRHKIARLQDHCERVGRDPATIEKSVLLTGLFALNEARRQIDAYAAAGVTHLIFSVSAATDRDFIRRFAREIIPAYKA